MKLKDIKYTIHVDMDGVLADLMKFVTDLTGHVLQDNDAVDGPAWDKFHEYMESGNKTFEVYDKLPDADELWNYVRPYQPKVLSATGHKHAKEVQRQKTAWMDKHFPDYSEINLPPKSRDKAKWAWSDAILIDDRMKSIGPWRKAGGIGILHVNTKETIAALKKLGL